MLNCLNNYVLFLEKTHVWYPFSTTLATKHTCSETEMPQSVKSFELNLDIASRQLKATTENLTSSGSTLAFSATQSLIARTQMCV